MGGDLLALFSWDCGGYFRWDFFAAGRGIILTDWLPDWFADFTWDLAAQSIGSVPISVIVRSISISIGSISIGSVSIWSISIRSVTISIGSISIRSVAISIGSIA